MSQYWNEEKPIVIGTGKNILRWFKNAEKLHVCLPDYQDDHGEKKQGKTVSLDIRALLESDDKEKIDQLLSQILSELRGEEV
jgi:hypothetical protein